MYKNYKRHIYPNVMCERGNVHAFQKTPPPISNRKSSLQPASFVYLIMPHDIPLTKEEKGGTVNLRCSGIGLDDVASALTRSKKVVWT